MDDRKVGVILRAIRVRKEMRQADVAAAAGLSASEIGKHERGELVGVTQRALRRHAAALAVRVELEVRGPAVDYLRDDEHASVAAYLKSWLESFGWDEVIVEASYSEFGERGRIDVFAWHAGRRAVLVTEIKTGIFDAQDLLGSLDVKERLATTLARQRGWRPATVSVLLAVTQTDASERKIRRLGALFGRFSLRGPAAHAWLRDPATAARLLLFVPAARVGRRAWRNSRTRVRPRRDRPAVNRPGGGANSDVQS